MYKQPLALNRFKLLLARLSSLTSKHQLCPERPFLGHIPLGLDLLVHDGVIMLQVGTEAFCLERDPERKLVHGGGVLGPGGEVVCIDGELFFKGVDWVWVFEEEDLGMQVSVHVWW
jgi:hypothetical protein